MALVILDDADDHRCGVAADHRPAPALGPEVSAWLTSPATPWRSRRR